MNDFAASGTRQRLEDIVVPGRGRREQAFDYLLWGALLIMLVWSFVPSDMNRIGDVFSGGSNMAMLLSDFLEPNFRYWRSYLDLMLETVQMAVWGSFLSVVFAVPFGLMSSSNLAPDWLVFLCGA